MAELTSDVFRRVARSLGDDYGITVRVGGAVATCDPETKTIHIPAVPDRLDDPGVLGGVRFWIDHEVGHLVAKSEANLKQEVAQTYGTTAAADILNILEDQRVNAIMASGWRGCGTNLRNGLPWLFERIKKQQPVESWHPLFQLGMASYFISAGVEIPKELDERVRKVAESYRQEIVTIPAWATCARDLIPLMERILNDMGNAYPPPKSGEQGQQGDASSEAAGSEPAGPSDQEQGTEAERSGQSVVRSGGGWVDGRDGLTNESPDIGELLARAVGDAISEARNGRNVVAPPAYPELDSREELNEELKHPGPVLKNKGLALLERARERSGPMQQRLVQMLQSESKCWWKGGAKTGLPDPGRLAHLATGAAAHVMRRRRVHKAPDTACHLSIDSSGSMGTGADSRMGYALEAATAFSLCLERGRVKNMVSLWSTGAHANTDDWARAAGLPEDELLNASKDASKREEMALKLAATGLRGTGTRLVVLKDWNTSVKQAAPVLAYGDGFMGGGTPMGESLWRAGKELIGRPERRKVLIVFTDGNSTSSRDIPFAKGSREVRHEDMRYRLGAVFAAMGWCRAHGVEVALVGIQSRGVARFQPDAPTVFCLDDLPKTTLAQLQQALRIGV